MPAAISDPYATSIEYRSELRKTDDGDDADVEADLLAVSRWLDRKLGRFFTKDATPQPRLFYPRVLARSAGLPMNWAETENPWRWGGYARVLHVDDMATVPTSIVIDEDGDGLFLDPPLLASDYELYPPNAPAGPEPWPYTALVLSINSQRFGFQANTRVQIMAQWGWPQIPEPIKAFTIEATAVWRLESVRATSRMNEMEQVISTSRTANNMLEELVRHYTKVEALL